MSDWEKFAHGPSDADLRRQRDNLVAFLRREVVRRSNSDMDDLRRSAPGLKAVADVIDDAGSTHMAIAVLESLQVALNASDTYRPGPSVRELLTEFGIAYAVPRAELDVEEFIDRFARAALRDFEQTPPPWEGR